MKDSIYAKRPVFTCAIYAVSPSHHLLQNLSSDVLHILSDLDPSGLDHEHILIHYGQRKEDDKLNTFYH